MTQQLPRGKRLMRAGLWASLQNVAREGIAFVVFLILARLFLDDRDFGVVALANSFVMLAQTVGQFGLGTALIRERDITDRHKTACFWAMQGFAATLAAGLMVLAGVFADWAGDPSVAPVLRFLSLGLILTFAGSVHQALLQRSFGFRALAVRALIAGLSGGVVAVTAAANGAGVWSLVALNLVTAGVSTILLWMSLPWRPEFALPVQELKELLPTGLRVTGISVVRYIGDTADRFIVGFFISVADLGLLYVSQRIVKALQTVLTQSINAVALPTFAEIQDDLPRVRNTYLTALRMCLIVAVPFFVGLALVSEQLVEAFLGPRWQNLSNLLSILAIAAAVSAPLYFNQPLLVAIGRSQQALQIATVGSATQVACVLAGASFGLVGVGFGLLARQLIMSGVWLYVLKQQIGFKLSDFLAAAKEPLLATALMSVAVLVLSVFPALPTAIGLLIRILVGGLSYLIALWVLDRHAVLQIVQLMRR